MDWDERFRNGDYPQNPEPSDTLRRYAETFPEGRALDVATGTGRNAVFLAEAGHDIDAIDQSVEGLKVTRKRTATRGLADRLRTIQADVSTFEFPTEEYAVVTISFFRAIDHMADIKEALVPGGILFVEHHLRSTDDVESGPSSDRYRFAANELLHGNLDLTVLHYAERTEERSDGRLAAIARLVARKESAPRQSYPKVAEPGSNRDR